LELELELGLLGTGSGNSVVAGGTGVVVLRRLVERSSVMAVGNAADAGTEVVTAVDAAGAVHMVDATAIAEETGEQLDPVTVPPVERVKVEMDKEKSPRTQTQANRHRRSTRHMTLMVE
jgi:hypothetical protein